MIERLEKNLEHHLKHNLPTHLMSESYHYSVLPAGKLFRPQLAMASYLDHGGSPDHLENPQEAISLLCSSLEIHHAYTLVHDDLPCMDDDDFRRGRESTHKKFGQWQALLAGDGLLSLSHQLIQPLNFETRRFFSWATGPRGLIFGQYMDLSQDAAHSFENMIVIHKLKTARLIQAALVGGYLVTINDFGSNELKESKKHYRLGDALGLSFQLIDDLCELGDQTLGDHEAAINPWIHHFSKTRDVLEKKISLINQSNNLKNITTIIESYLGKMRHKMMSGQSLIEERIKQPLPSFLIE